MEKSQKRFRAFENSIDAQVLVPGINAEFNDFIRSQTVVPVEKIGMHTNLDPFKTVEMLIHQYEGTPGIYFTSDYEDETLSRIIKTLFYPLKRLYHNYRPRNTRNWLFGLWRKASASKHGSNPFQFGNENATNSGKSSQSVLPF